MKKVVFLLVLLGILVGCGPASTDSVVVGSTPQQLWKQGDGSAGRFVDEEAGVVCWVYDGFYAGGIDCLPLSETKLDYGRTD